MAASRQHRCANDAEKDGSEGEIEGGVTILTLNALDLAATKAASDAAATEARRTGAVVSTKF